MILTFLLLTRRFKSNSNLLTYSIIAIDGKQVLVAVGDRVMIYDAQSGEMIDSKRAHRDVVYCLAYSKDG